jgi:hypothetical protein
MKQPEFTPDEWRPEPQPEGRLGPPGRKPPTAIATATPRPPGKPHRRYRPSRLQRIARGMLAVLLIGSAPVAVGALGLLAGGVAGLGVGAIGALVGLRVVRQWRRLHALQREQRSRDGFGPADSAAKSA